MIKTVTLRRNLEQAGHCVAEALSVVDNDEDINCAIEDVKQAIELLRETVLTKLLRFQQNP